MKNNQIYVNTRLGRIIATASTDPNYPGIYIDFEPADKGYTMPMVLVEAFSDKEDNKEKELRALVWGDKTKEDYTDEFVIYREADIDPDFIIVDAILVVSWDHGKTITQTACRADQKKMQVFDFWEEEILMPDVREYRNIDNIHVNIGGRLFPVVQEDILSTLEYEEKDRPYTYC